MKLNHLFIVCLPLVGCPKNPGPKSPSATVEPESVWGQEQAGSDLPAGWPSIEIPVGYRNLRVHSTMIREDGSVWAGGAATKIGQYQWILRIPAFGDPTHTVYDLGRILHISDNETAGAHAVGVLGGVPQDKAWYGDIDAYGNIGNKQTYLSDADGALLGVTSIEGGIAYVGYQVTDAGEDGWVVRGDEYGRDLWKRAYGDQENQRLDWVQSRGERLVAVGSSGTSADMDAWLVVVDLDGQIQLEKRWESPGHTGLTSAIFLPNGDLLGAGLHQQASDDYLEGAGGLWFARITPEGEVSWDRHERTDLSVVGAIRAHGDGYAIAALRGPVGTEREVVVAQVDANGTVSWTEIPGSVGATWADVMTSEDDALRVVMLSTSEAGVAWRFAEVQ